MLQCKIKAQEEWKKFKKFKKMEFFPSIDEKSPFFRELKGSIGSIKVGPVKEAGSNLPSGKNLSKYVDDQGSLDLLEFFEEHLGFFPLLHVLVQRHASIVSNEAGVERVFLQANLVANPSRANIGVGTYERLVKRKVNSKIIRVPVEMVMEDYVARKNGDRGGFCRKRKADDEAAAELEEQVEQGGNA